ncbi:MAG: DMT family transporter [Pseudomonadota bacterium]
MTALYPPIFVFLWATGFIGAKLSAPYSDPLSFLTLRFLIVAALLAMAVLWWRLPWPNPRAALNATIAGALIQGFYLGGIFWAIEHGMPAGVAALIVGLQPILTAFLAKPILGEAISQRHWLGLGVGLVGLVFVLGPKLQFSGFGITPVTITACVIGVLAITIGSVWQKRFGGGLDTRVDGVFQFLAGALVVGIGAAATETFTFVWAPSLIFALVWLVLVLSIGAITLYLILLRQGAVSKVAALFYLVPAVAALMGWFLFGETLTLMQIIGMAITVAAVALVSKAKPA